MTAASAEIAGVVCSDPTSPRRSGLTPSLRLEHPRRKTGHVTRGHQGPRHPGSKLRRGVARLKPGRAAAVAILTMHDGRRRRLAAILCSCRSTFLNLDTLNFCRDRNLRLSPPKTCGRFRSLLVLVSDLDSPRQRWQLAALTFLQNAILNASGFQALQENLTKSFIERVPQSKKRSLMAQLGKKLGYRLSGMLKQTAQLLAFKRDTTRKLKIAILPENSMFSDCLQKSLELISSFHRNRLVQLKCIHDALALSAQQRKQDFFSERFNEMQRRRVQKRQRSTLPCRPSQYRWTRDCQKNGRRRERRWAARRRR
ncbi:unnamed protein product [Ixodes hexagonus]